MPTTRVPAYRCGTNWSGWLHGVHPTVEAGEVDGKVCFSDRSTGCKDTRKIFVKNCGSYFIYKPHHPSFCHFRYCSTDWMCKFQEIIERTHRLFLGYTYFWDLRSPFFMIIIHFFYRFQLDTDDVLLTCNQQLFEFHILQSISFVIITNNQFLRK